MELENHKHRFQLDLQLFAEKVPTISPSEEATEDAFLGMLNGTATNQLATISKSDSFEEDRISGTASIKKGTVTVYFDDYSSLTGGLRVSTHKLLDVLTIALTKQNEYRGKDDKLKPAVCIPLDKYMELCGIPDTKASKDKTRRKVKEDLETLFRLSMEWTENSGKKTKDFQKTRLCSSVGIEKGYICMTFSHDMANYLTHAYVTQYPVELLKVDERNSNSYYIGRKLLLHHGMDNNIKNGTANIIKVSKLLEACPDIPSYDEVMSKGRQLEQRIKTPLENALNSLSFITWEYSNSKGRPLTDKQLESTAYKEYADLYIHFEVKDAPDQTKRIEAKLKDAEKKKARYSRRTSKKKDTSEN